MTTFSFSVLRALCTTIGGVTVFVIGLLEFNRPTEPKQEPPQQSKPSLAALTVENPELEKRGREFAALRRADPRWKEQRANVKACMIARYKHSTKTYAAVFEECRAKDAERN